MKRPRLTIRRMMAFTGVAACYFASFRIPELAQFLTASILTVVPVGYVVWMAIRLSRPGRRILVAALIGALWPLLFVLSLHAAWAIAYGFLGHAPGPADEGFWIEVLVISVFLFGITSPFWLLATAILTWFLCKRSAKEAVGIILLMSINWLVVFVVCGLDPAAAVWWFID